MEGTVCLTAQELESLASATAPHLAEALQSTVNVSLPGTQAPWGPHQTGPHHFSIDFNPTDFQGPVRSSPWGLTSWGLIWHQVSWAGTRSSSEAVLEMGQSQEGGGCLLRDDPARAPLQREAEKGLDNRALCSPLKTATLSHPHSPLPC